MLAVLVLAQTTQNITEKHRLEALKYSHFSLSRDVVVLLTQQIRVVGKVCSLANKKTLQINQKIVILTKEISLITTKRAILI